MLHLIMTMARRMIARWRFNNDSVTVLRAGQLAVGMVLSPHNHAMGVRVCGEKISGVEFGDEYGAPVVLVRSAAHYGVWPIRVTEPVSIITSSIPAGLTSRAS